ncbi:MAG TPA: PKD domain-containing protein, partial [Chitinophagaceae bacterium]|nr:PKD domain-containing protein [Chitinophagaceae bacterium]
AGVYEFELTVTDDAGAVSRDNVKIVVNPESNNCNGVRRVLYHHSWGGTFNGNTYTYNAGDTLVIRADDGWGALGLSLENFHGTKSCPIVIINEGGQTALGAILLRNCTYIKLTGSGSADFYGFYSNGAFSAIDIDGKSSNIEVERWKVTNAGYICRVKQDPSCDNSLNYPNWRMDNISVHDMWAKGIYQDGMYFGNTAPTTGREITCNGLKVSPIPMRLSNISIYNNYIDSVGRTGIQLSGCDSGYNEIYNNHVRRTGFELNQAQGSGIIIGGMAHAYVHDNVVRETFQFGILAMGAGFSRVENNDVDSSGILNGTINPGYRISIACNAVKTFPLDSSMIWIRNNLVGNGDAINISAGSAVPTWVRNGNIICGNKKQNGAEAYIQVGSNSGFFYNNDCSASNKSPVAKAGTAQTIILPASSVTLNGSGSYDPDGSVVTYNWARISGPNTPAIQAAASAITSVTGLVQGVYVFRLTVTDDKGATGTAQVTITVSTAAAANQAPVANAGNNQVI